MMETIFFAFLVSLLVTGIAIPYGIPILKKIKFGQYVRDDGPQSHLAKTGTPTMGGVIFMPIITVVGIIFSQGQSHVIAILLVGLSFAAVGFVDDYIKVFKKRSLGFKAYQKLLAQLGIAGGYLYYLAQGTEIGTRIIIPFSNGYQLDLGVLYIPFVLIVVLGTVNGVNLTDGLDGLAASVTLAVMIGFFIMSRMLAAQIEPLIAVILGGVLGYLFYNTHPAKIFMGDTGSLGLGGLVAALAIYLQLPLMILIIGFIYLAEVLSVIIQVGYFKKTGKRVFKMAPIHHHFEESGWKETRVVYTFVGVTVALGILSIISLMRW